MRMPLLIFEGCDNTGKDTLISKFLIKSRNLVLRHFSNPQGKTYEKMIEFQKEDFLFEFRKTRLREILTKTDTDYYIWNRSHIGEWVYGKIYRDYDSEWVFEMEKSFGFDKKNDVFLILLYADAEFTIKNDDGKSFTTDLEKRKFEIKRFHEAFEKSTIKNKIKIKVNLNKTTFKNKEDIYAEVHNFIRTRRHQ